MKNRVLALVAMVALACAIVPGGVAFASGSSGHVASVAPQSTASYKGLYEHTCGDPSAWGGQTPTKKPGYTLSLEILKKKSRSAKIVFNQLYFYGVVGYYIATSKATTVKLKKGKGSFTFRSSEGDRGRGRIKLVSKKRIKLSLETTVYGHERLPLSTGGKYKTLKRAKYQYHLYY